MQKYLIILIMCVVCFSGCAKAWSTEERQQFLEDCQDNQGDENICECILDCLENNYKNYSLVLDNLEKAEISKSLEQCISPCQ